MTQSQIHYFMAVGAERSITRAANRLFVSQPAISKSISALEKELGFPLFVRQDNVMRLTDAGKLLYDFFVRAADEYRQILKAAERCSEGDAVVLRVGCPASWNPDIFYGKITDAFAARYPAVQLAIECYTFSDLIVMLRNKLLDVILTPDLYDMEELALACRQVATAECGVVYSRRHYPRPRSIEDFRDVDFLLYGGGGSKRVGAMIRDACGDRFTPKMRDCGSASSAIFELFRGGGVMLLTDWDSAGYSELAGFLPLKMLLPVNAMYRRDAPNSSIEPFVRTVTELFYSAGDERRGIAR